MAGMQHELLSSLAPRTAPLSTEIVPLEGILEQRSDASLSGLPELLMATEDTLDGRVSGCELFSKVCGRERHKENGDQVSAPVCSLGGSKRQPFGVVAFVQEDNEISRDGQSRNSPMP